MSAFAHSCEFRPEPQDAFSEDEHLAWVESFEPRCIDDTPESDADLLDPSGGYEYDPAYDYDNEHDEYADLFGGDPIFQDYE